MVVKCEHGVDADIVCRKCDKERGVIHTDTSSTESLKNNIKESLEIKGMDDDYWHRRWAGDALSNFARSLYMNSSNELESKKNRIREIKANCQVAIEYADAMEKAFKEREGNEKRTV